MVVFLEDVYRQEQAARHARRDSLYAQLEQRYDEIVRAVDAGEDTAALERLWLALLDEYEEVCNQIDRFADRKRDAILGT